MELKSATKKLLKILNSSTTSTEKDIGLQTKTYLLKPSRRSLGKNIDNDIFSVEPFQPTLPCKITSQFPKFFKTIVQSRTKAKLKLSIQSDCFFSQSLCKQRSRSQKKRFSLAARAYDNHKRLPMLGENSAQRIRSSKVGLSFSRDKKEKSKQEHKKNYEGITIKTLRPTLKGYSQIRIQQPSWFF